jgi:hypothetical protein
MPQPYLDQATLKSLLHYDPETGIFTWKTRTDVNRAWNTRYAGKVAGYNWTPPPGNISYRSIRIFDWPFLGQRLAWLYMTGEWPENVVDHRDHDGLNNRWTNLRAADRPQNAANAGALRSNKLGLRGVCLHKPSGRYRATIRANGKQRHLGHFKTAEEARAAYIAAAIEIYGEFARQE